MGRTPLTQVNDVRVCVLLHPDEVVVCANIAGFRALADRLAELAESDPVEGFHSHLLWEFESEACKFEGKQPKNVWFLKHPSAEPYDGSVPDGTSAVESELTFQVLGEEQLDHLAAAQADGVIPPDWVKREASYVIDCKDE